MTPREIIARSVAPFVGQAVETQAVNKIMADLFDAGYVIVKVKRVERLPLDISGPRS
jgi:hypothetical protein